MIDALEIVAKRFRWSKPLVFMIGLVFLSVFLGSIFGLRGLESDIYLIPSILGIIWSAQFFFLVSTFPSIPPRPTKGTKFFARVKVRVKRGMYHVLGVVFILLTIAVVLLSFKMVGVWRADFSFPPH